MTFLGIVAALVLIAVFWRQLLGLAVVVAVVVGLLLAADTLVSEYQKPPAARKSPSRP